MRTAILLAASLAVLPAFSQSQSDLATTHDGSVLYFSYINPPMNLNTKIYRWSQDSGVTLFGDRPDLTLLPPEYGEHLYGTELTSAGSVTYHAEPHCSTGFGPGFNNCTIGETQIVIPGLQPFSVSGFMLISPNGRYGVFTPFNTGALWVDWFTGQQIEVNFNIYNSIPGVTPPFSVNQHAVANNGSFLITASGSDGLKVWSPSGENVLPLPDNYAVAASISADGSTVGVSIQANASLAIDLATGRQTTFPQPLSLSDDGKTVAYLTADPNSQSVAQAMVANADGTGSRQITNTPSGLRSALLSGDAHYLYVIAKIGDPSLSTTTQIQRYDLTTGAVVNIPAI